MYLLGSFKINVFKSVLISFNINWILFLTIDYQLLSSNEQITKETFDQAKQSLLE
jgi:hypothetical protein